MFSGLTTGRGRLSIGISAAIIMSMQDFVFPRTNTKPDGKQSKVAWLRSLSQPKHESPLTPAKPRPSRSWGSGGTHYFPLRTLLDLRLGVVVETGWTRLGALEEVENVPNQQLSLQKLLLDAPLVGPCRADSYAQYYMVTNVVHWEAGNVELTNPFRVIRIWYYVLAFNPFNPLPLSELNPFNPFFQSVQSVWVSLVQSVQSVFNPFNPFNVRG